MPDIFGNQPEDYTYRADLEEANLLERYDRSFAARHPGIAPRHDFNALGGGVDSLPPVYQRAAQDAQAYGFLTNNMLAIQSMVDEVLYTAYRLPRFISINSGIPEGANEYGVRVRERRGRARRLSAPGFEAPSATVSEGLVTQRIHWYGLDAEWSIDELRSAMMNGIPLDTEVVENAVLGTLETMEAIGLTGGEYSEPGLLNLPIAGDNAVTHNPRAGNGMDFATLTATAIRNLINGQLSAVIESSRETLGRNISTGMTVYLPGPQYDLLTTKYIGDNAERTVMRAIIEDNPWTHFTGGSPVMIERVLELSHEHNPGSATDRMIVALKHPRVAEMGVSIPPRVIRIMDKGRVYCAQIEAKFSPLFVKRPSTIHYSDNI